jgi:hypothetical protein
MFIHFLLIHYIFKRWGNYIYTHTHQKNHVDFKYVYLQVVYEKKRK